MNFKIAACLVLNLVDVTWDKVTEIFFLNIIFSIVLRKSDILGIDKLQIIDCGQHFVWNEKIYETEQEICFSSTCCEHPIKPACLQ